MAVNKEFRVNEYITLKLECGKTNIYVGGKLFQQCKHLLLINPHLKNEQKEIDSIDEASELLSSELEREIEPIELGITPEEEFWGHCSNIQAWIENNYDTRIIHSNLSIPLLTKLIDAGDLLAKHRIKFEILNILERMYIPSIYMLLLNNSLNYLNIEEIENTILNTDLLIKMVNDKHDYIQENPSFTKYFFQRAKHAYHEKILELINKGDYYNAVLLIEDDETISYLNEILKDKFLSFLKLIKKDYYIHYKEKFNKYVI